MKRSHPKYYWNDFEKCKIEASKYNSRTEFQQKSKAAYTSASKNKWIDIFIPSKSENRDHITFDKCLEVAYMCQTKKELKLKHSQVYSVILKNKWLEEINNKCGFKSQNRYFWTKNKCHEKALLCKTKKEFVEKYPSAYSFARINGFIGDICGHMIPIGNIFKRCIYVFEFKNLNTCYIGLTCDIKKRENAHIRDINSSVYKFIKNNSNCEYKLFQLTDYIDVKKSQEMEQLYIDKYLKNNWIVLNIAKAGSIGGNGGKDKFTYEHCKSISSKYAKIKDFRINEKSVYLKCKKNGWLDELCSNMESRYSIYTFQRCQHSANKCQTSKEFSINYPKEYARSLSKGWIGKFNLHRETKSLECKYDFTTCMKCSELCKNKTEFYRKYKTAWKYSKKNGWLDIFYPTTKLN